MLNSVCPVSVAVADKHIRMTKGKSLKEVLKLEFRAMRFQQRLVNKKIFFGRCLNSTVFRDKNFFEGVRALLVDKDNNPKFDPATLERILKFSR